MSAEPDEVLDVSVQGFVTEKECGHFTFGVEIDLCLTEQEANRACAVLYQLLSANFALILGRVVTVTVEPPSGSMMN